MENVNKEVVILQLRKIIEESPEMLYLKDVNGKFLVCNKNVARVLKLKNPDDIVGKTDEEVLGKKYAELVKEQNALVYRDKKEVKTEEIGFDEKGREAVYLSTKKPIFDKEQNFIGLLGTSIDITELKNSQKALEDQVHKTELAYKLNSQFLSVASHEIRGPVSNVITLLNAIKNHSALKESLEKIDGIASLDNAISESRDALKSIDYLLKYLSLDRQVFEYKPSLCKLNNFMENIFSDINREYAENHRDDLLKLNYTIHQSVPADIKFNHYHLREIIEILIKNAIKYSFKNPCVSVHVEMDKLEKNNLIFRINDKGVGMAAEQLNNLLNPIFPDAELDKTLKYIKPSIKLSYINKLIKLMGGKLDVKSKQGVGTEFKVYVPCEKNEEARHTDLNKANTEKLTILIVEDNKMTLTIHKNELCTLGHSIDSAETGLAALALAEKNEYDIIFVNITLPDINGIDVMNRINSMSKKEKQIDQPFFVAVTSHSSDEDILYFNEQGFSTVLIKPVIKEDFKECVETIQRIKAEERMGD